MEQLWYQQCENPYPPSGWTTCSPTSLQWNIKVLSHSFCINQRSLHQSGSDVSGSPVVSFCALDYWWLHGLGLWLSIGTVISRVHVRKDVPICCCPWFSKCLPFCDVSAGFNVTKGEKKLNNSNSIIKYPSCRNFNLGRESKIDRACHWWLFNA